MPISKTISQCSDYRLTLSHYAPGEECRAHRHAGAQTSLLIAGGYLEETSRGRFLVEGRSLSLKPAGFEHQNRFGNEGALILSIHGPEGKADIPEYRVSACDLTARDFGQLLSAAAQGLPLSSFAKPTEQARGEPMAGFMTEARTRLLNDPDLSIQVLARSTGLHPVSFTRRFRKGFGCPPSSLRRAVRTARAVDRIIRSSASLAMIAGDEGFADQAHMTRAISQTCGWSPGALRRLLS